MQVADIMESVKNGRYHTLRAELEQVGMEIAALGGLKNIELGL
jgi:hypothetical protein